MFRGIAIYVGIYCKYTCLLYTCSEVGSNTSTNANEEEEEMKYLVFDEISREEMDKTTPNLQVHIEEREKGNIPPHVFPDHILHGDLPQFTQSMRFFKIYEVDDPKQLTNITALYSANNLKTHKRWVIPITELNEFRPAYEQYKKKMK